jgi:ATP-dependent Lhr-like helicase
MALTLQTGGLAVADWLYWLGRVFADLPEPPVCETLNYMLREGILVADTGILGLGPRGESEFGRRHFLELVSASPRRSC